MAREKLAAIDGQRMRFTATVERFGTKRAFRGPDLATILLRDVRRADSNQIVTDHLWFTQGRWSAALRAGQRFAFDARVDTYIKGYRGYRDIYDRPPELDWHLTRPTRVEIIDSHEGHST